MPGALQTRNLRRAIEEKHRAAVKAALSFLEEKCGFARIGTDGLERVKCPLLFALFDHGTREPKTSSFTRTPFSSTSRGTETAGRPPLTQPTFTDWKMAGGAVYRLVLGQGMLELGAKLKERQIGSSIGWELACDSRGLD